MEEINQPFDCYLLTFDFSFSKLLNKLLKISALKKVQICLKYEEKEKIAFIKGDNSNEIVTQINYENIEEIREGPKTEAWIKAEENLDKMLNEAEIPQEQALDYFSIVCKSKQRILPGDTHDFFTSDEKLATELRNLRDFIHELKKNNKLLKDVSREGCLFDSTINHDMDQPMSHYFIASSHNTYLPGKQIGSPSSYEIYRNILLDGCRCIEIDIWEGKKEPIVTHACKNLRFAGKILLLKVLEIIKEFAFVTSEYPLILSIENHLEKKSQNLLAKMLYETFGEMLYIGEIEPSKTKYPALSEMKNKIFIKDYKKLRIPKTKRITDQPVQIDDSQHVDSVGDSTVTRGDFDNDKLNDDYYDYDEWDSDKFNLSDDEYDYDEWDCDEEDDPDDANCDRQLEEASSPFQDGLKFSKSKPRDLLENYSPKYSQMINYFEANKFKANIETCIKEFKFHQMFSRKETKSLEILEESIRNIMKKNCGQNKYREFTRTNMVRVYPRGRRQDSSNYNPVRHWYAGAQMVALNYQTASVEMLINWAQFALNGGCGYVLKPVYLRTQTPKPAGIDLHIEIVRGDFGNLFLGNMKTELKVTTRVYCPDTVKLRNSQILKRDNYIDEPMETKIISDNGVNPAWDHLMEKSYHLSNPELSFVLFSLMNGTDCTVGQYMIAVQAMKTEGWIDLFDNKMNKIPSAKIYVKVSKITEKKGEGVCN